MFAKILESILDVGSPEKVGTFSKMLLESDVLQSNEIGIVKQVYDCSQRGVVLAKENVADSVSFEGSTVSEDGIPSLITMFVVQRKNKVAARKLMQVASLIGDGGYTEEAHQQISALLSSVSTVQAVEYEDPLSEAQALYRAKKEQGSGMKFGVNTIDKAIGGIQPGSFNTIFAYVGSYKTMSAVNIAYMNSFSGGFNVCYISLEVVKADLMWNIYSRHSVGMHSDKCQFLPHDKLRNATLSEREEKFFVEDVIPDYNSKSQGKLYLLDESDFSNLTFLGFEQALRTVESKCKEETGKGIDCVIVDQAQLLKYGSKDASTDGGGIINTWVSFFRQQCLNFLGTGRPIVVIMLSQANREGWKRAVKNEGRYDLRAISEANELERASWRVFSLFTDENMKESKEVKVQCLKNRTGQTVMDPVVVYADPVCYAFGDIAEGFNDILSVDSIDDIFSSTFDVGELFS